MVKVSRTWSPGQIGHKWSSDQLQIIHAISEMQDFLNHPTKVTVKPKTLWIRFYADISETIHHIFIQTHNSMHSPGDHESIIMTTGV